MPSFFSQLRRTHLLWLIALGLGLLLRIWFLHHPMPLDDDTDVYAELGSNLFQHHIYGFGIDNTLTPSIIRLPGYPIFLASLFAIFGQGNYTAIFIAQIFIDLLGCYLIASFARDHISTRAGTTAIFLAALCPFTAAYATIALTECLSIFAVSLCLWSTGRLLNSLLSAKIDRTALLLTSTSMALAMLLRPDGALLTIATLFAILWYSRKQRLLRSGIALALICACLTAIPMVAWTIRNWTTFHIFQPLAPRRVNDPGEVVNYGFYHWVNTWSADIVSTGNVYWQVGAAHINIDDLPSRAFDSPAQYAQTAAILADYNVDNTVTPDIDARFQALATKRNHDHPLLCRIWVPTLRVVDMWLRPRTETLGLDADWWLYSKHHQESIEADILGLINLALVATAIIGFARRRIPFAALPIAYITMRCLLLSTMENSEPRYTLEAFPILFIAAAAALTSTRSKQAPAHPPASALPSHGGAG